MLTSLPFRGLLLYENMYDVPFSIVESNTAVYLISYLNSMFSFFGCLLVVISIIKLKKLQTVTFMIIGFQMSAEGLYNLGHAIFLYPPKDNTPLCSIQAFILAWYVNVKLFP